MFFFLEDELVEIDFASETDLAVVLANHLFGELATSSSYTIDKTCHAKRKGNRCFCNDEKCVLKGVYGDTSIGTNTWLFETYTFWIKFGFCFKRDKLCFGLSTGFDLLTRKIDF